MGVSRGIGRATPVALSQPGHATGAWRKQVHVAMIGFAVLLRWLPYVGALGAALVAVAFNTLVLPRVTRAKTLLYRAGERTDGLGGGIMWYPVSVFVLLFALPLPVAAAGWGYMALGDGMAAIIGQRAHSRPWPWNPAKTLAGSAALVVCGTAAACALFMFVRANMAGSPPWWRGTDLLEACRAVALPGMLWRASVTGIAIAIVESLPLRLDDNVSVPLTGGVLLTVSFMV